MTKLSKFMAGLTLAIALFTSSIVPAQAQATLSYVQRYAAHVTTNATATPTSTDAYVVSVVICVTVAGASSNTLTIQNKEGTPKVLFKATNIAVGTTTIALGPSQAAILMKGGIDIITATGTAPTADVFITSYRP